jgi:hypothetical protein
VVAVVLAAATLAADGPTLEPLSYGNPGLVVDQASR